MSLSDKYSREFINTRGKQFRVVVSEKDGRPKGPCWAWHLYDDQSKCVAFSNWCFLESRDANTSGTRRANSDYGATPSGPWVPVMG